MNSAESFLTVLHQHKGIVYKIANAYCQDADDRKDLVQEISIQLWKSFPSYSNQYQYSTWIYRIALNTAISFYRKERRQPLTLGEIPENILWMDEDDSPLNENLQRLQQWIAELKPLNRALMLLYLEEKSYREIAGIMGITESHVATKISRIKLQLKQKFSNVTTNNHGRR